MLKLFVVLILFTSVFTESVRETETWMPMRTTQTAAMLTQRRDTEASGDGANGSDFGFMSPELDGDLDDGEGKRFDDEDSYDDYDDDDDDDDDYEASGGSGDDETTVAPHDQTRMKPDVNDNKIPELQRPVRPTVDEVEIVRNSNEIPLRNDRKGGEELPPNVLMAQATDDSILNKTEVLAALIAGGAVGLMFAVLLILFLLYRMKKKDEGSYDLGKKPIYKKAPTTEIYA